MRKELREKIKSSPEVSVDLSDLNIIDDEVNEIVAELQKSHVNVKSVFLNNNDISDRGAKTLSEGLAKLKALTFLDVQFNLIDKAGAAAIVALKTTHPEITIALHGNKITNVGEMKAIEDGVMGRSK